MLFAFLRRCLSSASDFAFAATATVPRYSRITAVHFSTRSTAAEGGPATERVEAAVSWANACLVFQGVGLVSFIWLFEMFQCRTQDGEICVSNKERRHSVQRGEGEREGVKILHGPPLSAVSSDWALENPRLYPNEV